MAELCSRFNIARKTGYEWVNRYKSEGWEGLNTKSTAPLRRPRAMNCAIRIALFDLITAHPDFGARRLQAALAVRFPDQPMYSLSTISTHTKNIRNMIPKFEELAAPR